MKKKKCVTNLKINGTRARARACTYACICRIRCEDITRYMNITTHPLWIFIFPRRHNPPARFNHAVNLSARALIHRFFSVRLSAIGYNRNADIDFTLSRIPANGPSFVWEIFSRTRPSSCVTLHYRISSIALGLSESRNSDTCNMRRPFHRKSSSRPANTRPW